MNSNSANQQVVNIKGGIVSGLVINAKRIKVVVRFKIKAIGIAYTAQLASSICRDLGESSLAISAELVGRILIALLALPLIRSLAETLINLIDKVL